MAINSPVKVTQAIFEGHHHHPYGPVDNNFSDCDESRANDEDNLPGNETLRKELIPSETTGDMASHSPVKVTQAKFEGHHHHPYGPVDNTFSDCDESRANDEDNLPGNETLTKELIPSETTGDMASHSPVKVTQANFEGHHHHPYGPVDNTFSDCDETRANDEDNLPGNETLTKELIPSVGIMTLAPDPDIVVEEKLTPPPVESPTKTSFDEKSSGDYSISSYHGQAERSIGSQAGHISSSRGPSGGQRAFRSCVHK